MTKGRARLAPIDQQLLAVVPQDAERPIDDYMEDEIPYSKISQAIIKSVKSICALRKSMQVESCCGGVARLLGGKASSEFSL